MRTHQVGGKLHWLDKLLIVMTLSAAMIIIVAGCSSQSQNEQHDHTVAATESEVLETTASIKNMPKFLHNHTANTSKLYGEVGSYQELLEQLNCYCGCMLDAVPHDNLFRCYISEITEQAVTWTDHSTSCGICKMEAEEAIAMAKQGMSFDEIREAIDDKFKPRNL